LERGNIFQLLPHIIFIPNPSSSFPFNYINCSGIHDIPGGGRVIQNTEGDLRRFSLLEKNIYIFLL